MLRVIGRRLARLKSRPDARLRFCHRLLSGHSRLGPAGSRLAGQCPSDEDLIEQLPAGKY